MELLSALTLMHFISLFAFGIGAEVMKKLANYYLMPKKVERLMMLLPAIVILVGVLLCLVFPGATEVLLFGSVMSLVVYDVVVKALRKTIREYKREQ